MSYGARSLRGLIAFGILLTSFPALGAVVIDGRLTEPEWERAQVFTDFRVTQPYTLGKPSLPTEARIIGTPDGILVGMRCTHPPSVPRQQEQTPRDADNEGDRVNIYIDFDADARVAYDFTIALAGSLQDATVTNENRYDTDWDGDITYAVYKTEDEWFVEVLIPWTLASMKNPGTGKRTIAVAFDRMIGVVQERSVLHGITPSQPRFMSEFPKIEIDQFKRSLFHVFPYTTVASDWVGEEMDLKAGADILWKPSGNFQLTAALAPDFGQVEADDLVVNFDAIEVLFSDKRPFFSENQSLFDVRIPGTNVRDAGTDRLLYTRRIGGARDDDPLRGADVDGAVKINGSIGQLDYGLLSAVEEDYGNDIGRAFAAQRLRYSGNEWTLGYLGTWVDRPFLDRNAQVHSSDFTWRPSSRWMFQGQAIASIIEQERDQTSGDGEVLQLFYTPSPDWQHELGLTHFAGTLNFNDMGFQERASLNRASYSMARRFRNFGANDRRASVTWRLEPELRWNDSGERLGHYIGIFRDSQQRSGATVESSLEVTGEGIDDLISRNNGDVRIEPRLAWLQQSYQSVRFGKWRAFAASALFQEGNDDFAFQVESKIEHFPREDLSWSLRGVMLWSRDWLIWREDNLLASFHRTRALLAGDLNWFPAFNQELRLKLQWLAIDARDPTPLRVDASGRLVESADLVQPFQVNTLGLQIRYRWTFAPQSDLYVVYGRGGDSFEQDVLESGLGGMLKSAVDLRDSDQLLVKVRYRF